MSPEEQEALARSMGNLWTLNALVVSRLARTIREQDVPAEAVRELLDDLYDTFDSLECEENQDYAAHLFDVLRRGLLGA